MFPVDGKNNESESKAQKNAVPDPDREIREWGVDLQKILVYEIWSKNKGGRESCPGSATEINDARKSSATSRRSNGTDLCSLEDCTGTRVFDKITFFITKTKTRNNKNTNEKKFTQHCMQTGVQQRPDYKIIIAVINLPYYCISHSSSDH